MEKEKLVTSPDCGLTAGQTARLTIGRKITSTLYSRLFGRRCLATGLNVTILRLVVPQLAVLSPATATTSPNVITNSQTTDCLCDPLLI
jgi:hypothetical protein